MLGGPDFKIGYKLNVVSGYDESFCIVCENEAGKSASRKSRIHQLSKCNTEIKASDLSTKHKVVLYTGNSGVMEPVLNRNDFFTPNSVDCQIDNCDLDPTSTLV